MRATSLCPPQDAPRPLHSNAYLRRLLSSAHSSGRVQALQQVLLFRRDLSFLDYSYIRQRIEMEPASDLYRPLLKLVAKFERQSYKAASAAREQVVGSLPVLDSTHDAIPVETAVLSESLQQLFALSTPSAHTPLRLIVRRLWERYDSGLLDSDLRQALTSVDRGLSSENHAKAPTLIAAVLSSIYRELRDGEPSRQTRSSKRGCDGNERMVRYFKFAGTLLSGLLSTQLSSDALSSLVEFSCWMLGVVFVTMKFEIQLRSTFEDIFGTKQEVLKQS